MGQIVSAAAKPKRCNLNQLSQVPTPAAGEYILVSSDNSMNAAGQGNFDCYIEGDGQKAATELELKEIDEGLKSVVAQFADEEYDYTFHVAANGRLNQNITSVNVGSTYKLKYTANVTAGKVNVYAYNGNTLVQSLGSIYQDGELEVTIPANTTRMNLLGVNPTTTEAGDLFFNITNKGGVTILQEDVDKLNDEIFGTTKETQFVSTVDSKVLAELYLPLADSTYKVKAMSATSTGMVMNMMVSASNQNILNIGNIGTAYSGKIIPFADRTNGVMLGYFILNYTGTDYTKGGTLAVDVSKATDINNSPRIKKYLERQKNIVLCGDSLFGAQSQNLLTSLLIGNVDKKVANGGFAGCRMAWRVADGTNAYDPLSFVSVADAIVSGDWSAQVAAANSIPAKYYNERVAELQDVDWTKPTTLLIEYSNNDLTGGVQIGDLWTAGSTTFDKTTLLGALNYGLNKILTAYPKTRVIVFTPAWRYMSNQPPYSYTNANGDSVATYSAAIKENCARLGISVWDFAAYGGRNEWSRTVLLQDDSHYNIDGFAELAEMLARVDDNDMM